MVYYIKFKDITCSSESKILIKTSIFVEIVMSKTSK